MVVSLGRSRSVAATGINSPDFTSVGRKLRLRPLLGALPNSLPREAINLLPQFASLTTEIAAAAAAAQSAAAANVAAEVSSAVDDRGGGAGRRGGGRRSR